MLSSSYKTLDLKTSSCLKGILACMVLLCHLYGRVGFFSRTPLGAVFTAFGYLAVSVFFFLSGFGLTEAASLKEGYLKNFPLKKLFPFFLICSFTILIYLVRDILVGSTVKPLLLIQSFLFGNTIVNNGWYLQSQFVFYIIFYLIFRFIKSHTYLALVVSFIAYIFICVALGLSSTWYEAAFCFPLGVFYSKYKDKIHCFIFANKLKPIIALLFILILFVIALFLGNRPYFVEPIRITVKIISALLCCCFCTLSVLLVNIKNTITSFLGRLSLEIYLLQGIFLNLFQKTWPIENDLLYIVAVVLCTILFAIVFHPIYNKLSKPNFCSKK